MVATLYADPNPVLISAWRLSPMEVDVYWDTGGPFSGIVYLSIDGSDEDAFDGLPNGKRNGRKSQKIELGKTYDFRLRRTNVGQTLVASMRIKGEEKLGTTLGLLQTAENMIPRSQHIFDLRVTPGIESVNIHFRTRQAAHCFVEITNDEKRTVVAVALLGAAHSHDVLIAKGSAFTPNRLEQGVNHTFRIVAPALPGSLDPSDKIVTGSFRTGIRTAQFFYNRILIHNDGDPGFFLGDGDFNFFFGAGDVEEEVNLGNEESYGRECIGSGQFRDVNRVVTISNAPPLLWSQVHVYEDDSVFVEFFGEPETFYAPAGTTCWRGDDGPESQVTQHFDFLNLTEGIEEFPFDLSNGNCSIHFTVNCRVKVEAFPGVLLQPHIQNVGPPPRSPVPQAAIIQRDGDKVSVRSKSGHSHQVRLAAGGAAFVKVASRRSRNSPDQWVRLEGEFAGPMTLVAAAENRVDFFALKTDGTIAHRSWSQDGHQSPEWEALGGTFAEPVVAATGLDQRIELFGLTETGQVLHRAVASSAASEASRDWQPVGEGPVHLINAFSSPQGDVSLVALNDRGEILHKLRRGDAWQPAGRSWQSLGTAPAHSLSFSAEYVDDDLVVFAVVTEDESIYLLPWWNYPAPPKDGWRRVGTINDLIDARFSLRDLIGRSDLPNRL